MAHPQTTPRGLIAAKRFDVGSTNITYDSSGIVLAGGLKISNKQGITANTTGFVHANAASALPGNVDNGKLWGVISNSTGVCLFVNSTGTTHKYLNVTTLQPT